MKIYLVIVDTKDAASVVKSSTSLERCLEHAEKLAKYLAETGDEMTRVTVETSELEEE